MVAVSSEIVILCPVEECFDAARNLEVHVEAERHRHERIVSRGNGILLGAGESVTFEAVHFGVRQRLTSKIVEFDRPTIFVDQMQRGAFKSLRHTHRFEEIVDGTRMSDTLEFEAPLGLLGRVAEAAFLRTYMLEFVKRHQREFKLIVERKIS